MEIFTRIILAQNLIRSNIVILCFYLLIYKLNEYVIMDVVAAFFKGFFYVN